MAKSGGNDPRFLIAVDPDLKIVEIYERFEKVEKPVLRTTYFASTSIGMRINVERAHRTVEREERKQIRKQRLRRSVDGYDGLYRIRRSQLTTCCG